MRDAVHSYYVERANFKPNVVPNIEQAISDEDDAFLSLATVFVYQFRSTLKHDAMQLGLKIY